MTIFNEPLMIATVPDHVLAGLSVYFAFAAVSLFCMAVEKGVYPEFRRWLAGLYPRFVRYREQKQRWAYYAVGGHRVLSPA